MNLFNRMNTYFKDGMGELDNATQTEVKMTQTQKLVAALYNDKNGVSTGAITLLGKIPYDNKTLVNLLPANKPENTSEAALTEWLTKKVFNENVSGIIAETLYNTYVAGMVFLKDSLGTIAAGIASNSAKAFDYNDAEKLEKVRQVLASQPLTIQHVAKMFELRKDLELLNVEIQRNVTVTDALEAIGKKLQEELEKIGGDLSGNLKALQTNDSHWYDNDTINGFIESDAGKKIVEYYRAVMQWLTDFLISLSSVGKDLGNYIKPEKFEKNSAEELSDFRSKLRKEDPVAYAAVSQLQL